MIHDFRAAIGVPAHVTVHYPWVPAETVDAATLDQVRDLAATTPPFPVTFSELRWFASDVLWLAPTPDHELRELSERSAALWPEAPQYGGEFEDVMPHLTIGDLAGGGDEAGLHQAGDDLAAVLPLPAWAAELWWMALEPTGRWTCRATFKLGGSS